MKSNINRVSMCYHLPDWLDRSSIICEDVVAQWETFSGRGTSFTFWYDETNFGIYETCEVRGCPSPIITFTNEGVVLMYSNRDDLWSERTDYADPVAVKGVNKEYGIEDIFNLKPHEKGLLKLKHGLYGAWLFFPTQLLELVKKQRELV